MTKMHWIGGRVKDLHVGSVFSFDDIDDCFTVKKIERGEEYRIVTDTVTMLGLGEDDEILIMEMA